MLITDFRVIGNKLYAVRKRYGMTQLDVAVAAEISERAYADIERGTANMRMRTFLNICQALHIRPDEILTENVESATIQIEELLAKLEYCSPKDRERAMRVLEIFFDS